MKRTLPVFIIAFFLTASIPVFSAVETLDLPISEVTVYPNQAQVTRFARQELPAGEHTLVIENLPLTARDESFRVSVSETDGLKLLGFNHKLERKLISTQGSIAELEKQIEDITRNERQVLQNRLETYREQKELVLQLSRSASKGSSDEDHDYRIDISQWQTAFDFIGTSLESINESIRITNNKIVDVNRRLDKLREDLSSIQSTESKSIKTVQIDLQCDRLCAFDLELKYVVFGAEWIPIYDARLLDDSSVHLTYYANIEQKTGEDWQDVKLVVSTARPSHALGPGMLPAWYLTSAPELDSALGSRRSVDPEMIRSNTAALTSNDVRGLENIMSSEIPAAMVEEFSRMLEERGNRGTTASIGEDNYSITFNPPGVKTIQSGEQAVRILIDEWELESRSINVSIPKNRQEVYRLAEITNQDRAPLIPGAVSVFSSGDFLGKTEFNEYIAPGESFELHFGVENRIKVERAIVQQNQDQENGIFSKDKVIHERTIQITLENNSTAKQDIRLEEALPISRDSRISIKFDKIEPPFNFQNERGRTVWNLTLDPGEKKIVRIPFKVEHPKEINISGL